MSRSAPESFEVCNGANIFTITAYGREAWALRSLVGAGQRGCTPIDHPGPRWSAYVFDLRKMGVHIDTIHEKHGAPYPGTHARYVLRSIVRPLGEREAA